MSEVLTPEESHADYIASCEVGNAAIRAKALAFGDLELGRYGAILADPPWAYQPWSTKGSGRLPDRHYNVMGIEQIVALPVAELAARDCMLFLWVTAPCLPLGIETLKSWGFKYSSVAFTWMKLKRNFNPNQFRFVATAESDLHLGLGLTTRKNAEFCLLGRRGSPKRLAADVREAILAPVREHSRKPDGIHGRIERLVAGPYVELFARERRPGWDAWGNETDKFPAPNAGFS